MGCCIPRRAARDRPAKEEAGRAAPGEGGELLQLCGAAYGGSVQSIEVVCPSADGGRGWLLAGTRPAVADAGRQVLCSELAALAAAAGCEAQGALSVHVTGNSAVAACVGLDGQRLLLFTVDLPAVDGIDTSVGLDLSAAEEAMRPVLLRARQVVANAESRAPPGG
eukprot:TRINITY_DN25687_c0_g1_i1.p1 TRINITY_DN25687_c0_g1~~TRINITY_DN25687_c0_g1_i1.p1  ORF type:complete len:192 (+),score=53.61 TRINITY_DN25687_c0_g1_i1:79-576(+)